MSESKQNGEAPEFRLMLAAELSALPPSVRRYIHDLETRADPAGDVRRAHLAEETVKALQARIAYMAAEIEALRRQIPTESNR